MRDQWSPSGTAQKRIFIPTATESSISQGGRGLRYVPGGPVLRRPPYLLWNALPGVHSTQGVHGHLLQLQCRAHSPAASLPRGSPEPPCTPAEMSGSPPRRAAHSASTGSFTKDTKARLSRAPPAASLGPLWRVCFQPIPHVPSLGLATAVPGRPRGGEAPSPQQPRAQPEHHGP